MKRAIGLATNLLFLLVALAMVVILVEGLVVAVVATALVAECLQLEYH
jgi:hypothetical protein